MDFKDYYKVLEIDSKASADDVKRSFRRLARQYHPDANPDDSSAEQRFKELSEAYEVLSDPDKRGKYDTVFRQYQAFQAGGGAAGNTSWEAFQGNNRGATYDYGDFEDLFRGSSMSDFFQNLFGGGRGSAQQRRRPATQQYLVTLSLEEAFQGCKKRFTLDGRTVDVAFRPGIPEGQLLSIPLTSDSSTKALIKVHVAPHPRYERRGDDLYVEEPVPFSVAVLGGSVNVQTLSGRLSLSIPASTQPGKIFRLRGQGMPVYDHKGRRGDLYVAIEIHVPAAPSEDQRTAVESLRTTGL